MFLKFARNALGLIIVFFDWISRTKAQSRSAEEQLKVQNSLQGHSLYQFFACPFCVKTRRAIHKLGITIENRDINKNPDFRAELEAGGGRVKVPCLRIDSNDQSGDQSQWLYESNEIIDYLAKRVT